MSLTRIQIAALGAGTVLVGAIGVGVATVGAPAPPSYPGSAPSASPSYASPSDTPSAKPTRDVGHAAGSPIPLGVCVSHDGLPDGVCNPGSTDPRVTQANIHQTICVAGYTATVRPPVSQTNRFKRMQMRAYGYTQPSSLYELDHLISLELGGAPLAEKNLWPQLWDGATGAHTKDHLENVLHADVCSGKVPLAEAQSAISSDWVAAYAKYVGPLPK